MVVVGCNVVNKIRHVCFDVKLRRRQGTAEERKIVKFHVDHAKQLPLGNTIDHLADILTGENHRCLMIADHRLLCLMIKSQLIRVVTLLEFQYSLFVCLGVITRMNECTI